MNPTNHIFIFCTGSSSMNKIWMLNNPIYSWKVINNTYISSFLLKWLINSKSTCWTTWMKHVKLMIIIKDDDEITSTTLQHNKLILNNIFFAFKINNQIITHNSFFQRHNFCPAKIWPTWLNCILYIFPVR